MVDVSVSSQERLYVEVGELETMSIYILLVGLSVWLVIDLLIAGHIFLPSSSIFHPAENHGENKHQES